MHDGNGNRSERRGFIYLSYFLWPTVDAPNPDEVVRVETAFDKSSGGFNSYPDTLDLKKENRVFQQYAGYRLFGSAVKDKERTLFAWGHAVSGDYFSLFGALPEKGRLIQPSDDRPDSKKVLVLNHLFWTQQFHADPSVIGKTLVLNETYFDDVEWSAFESATSGKIKLTGVRIRDERVFKLYRDYAHPVPRGSAFLIDDSSAFLWTRGFVPRLQSNMGLETPNPLSILISKGNADIEIICRDVLMLTNLNYNACIYGDGLPVTLRFANAVGEILTAGPWKDEIEALPFKHYI